MGWILGFGIPTLWAVGALLTSRAVFRSRVKRELAFRADNTLNTDTMFAAAYIGVVWFIVGPIYFLTVHIQNRTKFKNRNLLKEFYFARLPETNRVQERRLLDQIFQLERED